MSCTNNPALETFVNLTEFDAEKLRDEYYESYKKIHKHCNTIRKEYANTRDNEKIKYRKMVYDAEREIIETIQMIEHYLPVNKRKFHLDIHNVLNKDVLYANNKTINIEEIVSNKIIQNEMLYLMVKLLTNRQYTCIYLYFWEGWTQEQIAKKFKITHQAVAIDIKWGLEKIARSEQFQDLINEIFNDNPL